MASDPNTHRHLRELLRERRADLLAAAARRGASTLRRLDYGRVWNTLREDIPRLRAAIERYRR